MIGALLLSPRRCWTRCAQGAILSLLLLLLATGSAAAVQPVFDPNGGSFYDMPFPHELRRDADGTVSLANFPFPSSPLIDPYKAVLEETPNFGLNSGVFFKFDGDLNVATLPADADASRQTTASVFLINMDSRSKLRGQRTPLWMEFRPTGDAYRDGHLLAMMPVPGHTLEPGTLYAAVVTDAVFGTDAVPLQTAALIQRMKDGTPQGTFETAALPLYRKLWRLLEGREHLDRSHVVTATMFRTSRPTDEMFAVRRYIAKHYHEAGAGLTFDAVRSAGQSGNCDHVFRNNYWVFTGTFQAPQFQTGAAPYTDAGSGKFTFDAMKRPILQHDDTLTFVLTVPKERMDGTIRMPTKGWPVAAYMHGTGGDRYSFVREGVAGVLASVGIATIGIDQPLHGLRPGATPDGEIFYNFANPYALRDNPRQAGADSLSVHQLLLRLQVSPFLITLQPEPGYTLSTRMMKFDSGRRMFMGHSQGGATGPLFLGVATGVRGGVLSAPSTHLLITILTREEPIEGLKLRDLISLLLGPIDLFHPALHLLQMGTDVSDGLSYARYFATKRRGRPLSLLITHGIQDAHVSTASNMPLAVAARYPLIAPTFPPLTFPLLPGYSYQEAFDLAGLPTLSTPVIGNIRSGRATGGELVFENDDHFAVFCDPDATAQYQEFMRSLAYDPDAVIPDR